MSTKVELEENIVAAVAALDQADGSRIGLQESMDAAREILSDAYGVGFEAAVTEYIEQEEDSDEDDAAGMESDSDGDGSDDD